MRLKPEIQKVVPIIEERNSNMEVSHFTTWDKKTKQYGMRSDRMALFVSSTSWTKGIHLAQFLCNSKDEDFSIMIDAMKQYEALAESSTKNSSPKVLVIVTGTVVIMVQPHSTGKGDLKSFYEEQMRGLHLKHVAMTTMWLEPDDYPLLLGSSDLGKRQDEVHILQIGISLHVSSSNLDLPMKVVDMFGCGLPVCAIGFKWYHFYTIIVT